MEKILGQSWTIERELADALAIAKKLKDDCTSRLISSVLAAIMIAWIGLPIVAIIWIGAVVLNEILDRIALRRLAQETAPTHSRLFPYFINIFAGPTIWCAMVMVLVWTGNGANFFLAIAILTGTLIHAFVFYADSRLQTVVAAAPVLFTTSLTIAYVITYSSIPYSEKFIIVCAMITVTAYLMAAGVQNIRTHEALSDLVAQTTEIAETDPLTGLQNRRAFLQSVNTWLQSQPNTCILFVDLDRFKPINDEYGHAVGDQVLTVIADRLRSSVGTRNVARLGGDEFAVLLSFDDRERQLEHYIAQLHANVTAAIPSEVGNVIIGASIGYAIFGEDGSTVSELLVAADAAMRRVKSDHGNPARFDVAVDGARLKSSALEVAFERALENGQLVAALQPIARARGCEIVAYELLARWQNSGLGHDPSPTEFVPVAEKLGLLDRLLLTTLNQCLPSIRNSHTNLAINISPSQLNSDGFLDRLQATLESHGVPNDRIELEITEQIAIRNLERNIARLKDAKDNGFKIVLDDFGTGYSSLSMLDALPLDKVKLDRSFVLRARSGPRTRHVLGATIRLVSDLDLECRVEGIEDEATAILVSSYGCSLIQGYWIGCPEVVTTRPGVISAPTDLERPAA
ncbi:MAG: EAL domain-containing protein [Pseudomonadota bacterium]